MVSLRICAVVQFTLTLSSVNTILSSYMIRANILSPCSRICGIWFPETQQKRRSLLDLWEASNVLPNPANSEPGKASVLNLKRNSDDNGNPEVPPSKRQKLTDGTEFKYISLANGDSHHAGAEDDLAGPNSLKGPEDDNHLVVRNNVIKYLQSKDGALPAGFNPEGSIQEMTAYLYGQQPSCLRRIWAHKISLFVRHPKLGSARELLFIVVNSGKAIAWLMATPDQIWHFPNPSPCCSSLRAEPPPF